MICNGDQEGVRHGGQQAETLMDKLLQRQDQGAQQKVFAEPPDHP